MTQALKDADMAPELAGELVPDEKLPAFARLADPVLPIQAGRFRLVRRIALGGMGAVYEAEDTVLGRVVALKMVRASRFASVEEMQRFELEARAAARLDHPHIVPVYEVGELEGQPFLSMKLITGETLAEKMVRGRLAARDAAAWMARLARAVQHAHDKGVLHRDLKPSNVLIDTEGHPWLTDFGMARLVDVAAGLTLTGAQIGTPSYMSPEQAAGRTQDTGPATDVWALGAMLYQMLSGELPYRGANHLAIMQSVIRDEPPRLVPANRAEQDLAVLVQRCLQKDPARRLGSAGELADELRRWLDGEPIRARPLTPVEKSLRWLRQHPAAAILSLGLLGGALVMSGRLGAGSMVGAGAHILPPKGIAAPFFGRAIALEGDTLAVGAPLHGTGAVIVYERDSSGRWSVKATLKPAPGKEGGEFGRAIALQGDTLVIGAHHEDSGLPASGAVHVFTRKNGTWSETAVLTPPKPQVESGFGRSVAVDSGWVVVGARLEDVEGRADAGAVHVFERAGEKWQHQARLVSPRPGVQHLFGISVAAENGTILVGADGEDVLEVPRHYYSNRQPSVGAAYVFTRERGVWSMQSRLAPPEGGGGCFGYSVALSGDTALIGAYRENSSTTGTRSQADLACQEAGAAFVFTRTGSSWTQQAYLKPHNTASGSRFGFDVALKGSQALIGAYTENSASSGIDGTGKGKVLESGGAYYFIREGGFWTQKAYLKAVQPSPLDHLGVAVDVDGDILAAGACGNDREPFSGGQVWLWQVKN